VAGDGKSIDATGITWIVSPYDEFAVEEALRIKEKRGQGEVVAVSLGPDRVMEALRSCLAMGCDRAIHLNDAAWSAADTLATAKALAAVIKQEAPELVLCGRQAIDDDMGAVRGQRAELLGWPCAYWIMEETVDADGKSVRAARQVEGGLEVFDLPLPAVLAAQKGLNEPRYPTLKGIMGAKKKEIRDVKAADLGLGAEPSQLSVVGLEALPPRPPGRIIGGGPVEAVWLTDKASDAGLKQLGEWGAGKVWLLENAGLAPYRSEVWAGALADLAAQQSPRAIFGAVTSRQRELVARLAARLG